MKPIELHKNIVDIQHLQIAYCILYMIKTKKAGTNILIIKKNNRSAFRNVNSFSITNIALATIIRISYL